MNWKILYLLKYLNPSSFMWSFRIRWSFKFSFYYYYLKFRVWKFPIKILEFKGRKSSLKNHIKYANSTIKERPIIHSQPSRKKMESYFIHVMIIAIFIGISFLWIKKPLRRNLMWCIFFSFFFISHLSGQKGLRKGFPVIYICVEKFSLEK